MFRWYKKFHEGWVAIENDEYCGWLHHVKKWQEYSTNKIIPKRSMHSASKWLQKMLSVNNETIRWHFCQKFIIFDIFIYVIKKSRFQSSNQFRIKMSLTLIFFPNHKYMYKHTFNTHTLFWTSNNLKSEVTFQELDW